LIAMSCPDVRSIDQDHHLGRGINFRVGIWLRYRHALGISRDMVGSMTHGRVAHRIAGQESRQQPNRLAVGGRGAQLSL
jgi:hypothetical protein